jgi:hypothetical protein
VRRSLFDHHAELQKAEAFMPRPNESIELHEAREK